MNSKKKVFTLIIILILIALSAVIGIKLKTTVVRKELEIGEIVKTIKDFHDYSKIMNAVTYQPRNDEILIDTQLKDSFTALSRLEQFAYFDAYCKAIRNYMNASKLNSDSSQKDIILTSSNLGDVYKYHSTCWNKEVKMEGFYGYLYVNDEQVYCQKQYKAFKSNHNNSLKEEFFNGYSDLDIMKYTVTVFNLITYGGEIRTLESDEKQITDEVIKRFGITQDDFRKIYRKYYYQYQ